MAASAGCPHVVEPSVSVTPFEIAPNCSDITGFDGQIGPSYQ